LRDRFGPIKSRLIALNVHDAVLRLVEASCDLLIAYHHPSQPFQLDPERYEYVSLGTETIAPYAQADAQGLPMFALPGRPASPLPYLGYAPGAYLGQLVEVILKEAPTPNHLDRVYETDMAEGLKAMALEGHGIAFLPHSAVKKELRTKKLVRAGEGMEITMDIRAYREKPVAKDPKAKPKDPSKDSSKATERTVKRTAQTLWDYLVDNAQLAKKRSA
jgi:LysR family transcriptional regulator, hypochlorite-specific transcription factor HypT